MTPKRGEWSKPAIILAILSIVANLGWAVYGMSQKASSDIEARLRAVEVTLSTVSANVGSLAATMGERSQRRDAQIADVLGRLRDVEHAGR